MHSFMGKRRLGLFVLLVGICMACLLCISACSSSKSESDASDGSQAEESLSIEANDAGTSESTASSSSDTDSSDADVAQSIASDTAEMDFEYSDRDQDASYDEDGACTITVEESKAEVQGDGASYADGVVTISQEGTYVVSGSSDDMQIVVEADDSAKVQLVLDGVDMTCETGPCIMVNAADKVFITLADGSSNSLADGSGFTITDEADEANATIYSTSDLTLNGSGSLSIEASAKNGINSKDDLVITGGSYSIDAANDALRGKDCVKILDGDFSLTAAGDGIVSSNDSDTDRGFVSIDGGTFSIDAQDEGIQATRYLRIEGGSLAIDAADDALHSDNDLSVDGGDITINAGDDAVHSEFNLHLASGNLDVESCYEGIESESILISGGENLVYSDDDGVNASAGSSTPEDESAEESEGGRGQAPMTGMEEGGFGDQGSVEITGGRTILICTNDGDSLDSNGSLTMSGGVVLISGTNSSDNGALDYDTDAVITGGTIMALGSPNMAQSFGSDSTQASVVATLEGSSGDLVSITNDDGEVIVSFQAQGDFSWLLASSAGIEDGESYHVCIGGTNSDADEFGFAESGQLSGASDEGSVEASTEASGMMGMGGMQGGGGMEGAGDMAPQGGGGMMGGDPGQQGTPGGKSDQELPSGEENGSGVSDPNASA